MDIYCPKCGEPWEMDSLHEEAQARYGVPYHVPVADPFAARRELNPAYDGEAYSRVYTEVSQSFRSNGCEALTEAYGSKCSTPSESTGNFGLRPQDAASALYDLLGDDMDGAAAMLDDLGY